MKSILLISPHFSKYPFSGNSISTQRIARGLKQAGLAVKIYDFVEGASLKELKSYDSPQTLFHCFNLVRCAPLLAVQQDSPLIASITGTDFEQYPQSQAFQAMAERCSRLLCQNEYQFQTLAPSYRKKLLKIAKGVLPPSFLGSEPYILPPRFAGKTIGLYPAGIREVKGQLLYLDSMKALSQRHPEILWVFVGEILDPAYSKGFLEQVTQSPDLCYLGVIKNRQMAFLYERAQFLINGSLSEGLSNVLLESSFWEIPLFCRNNSGNLGKPPLKDVLPLSFKDPKIF
jgi:glycosyltransferase involved in cell wall biosynthesis